MLGSPGSPEGPNKLKIETVKTLDGGEVSYCPERGGIITSIKLHGKEILYMDEATFQDTKLSVKGGIPVLFPNAGPIQSPRFPDLKQHGFARDFRWQAQKWGSSFLQTLRANNDTKKIFPYNFKLSLGGQFDEDESFSIAQVVENTGAEVMPISMGLHPYFRVPHDAKKDIKFNFTAGDLVEQNIEQWANGVAFKIDNPKVIDPTAVMEVVIPSLGTLIIDASPAYQRIWVWSLPGKDFVCIEPVMRDTGGLVNNPEEVQPGAVFKAEVNIKLKE